VLFIVLEWRLSRSLGWKNPTVETDTVLERVSNDRPPELVFDDGDSGKPFEKKEEVVATPVPIKEANSS